MYTTFLVWNFLSLVYLLYFLYVMFMWICLCIYSLVHVKTLTYSLSNILFEIGMILGSSKYYFLSSIFYFYLFSFTATQRQSSCFVYRIPGLIHWLVCCLLAGPDLWKRMPLKCSITMIFPCPLLLCKISSPFRNIIMW